MRRSPGATQQRLAAASADLLAFPLLALYCLSLLLPLGCSGVTVLEAQLQHDSRSLLASGTAAAHSIAPGATVASAVATTATSGSGSANGGAAADGASAIASSASDGYSALCVVGRNENLYIREWVDYHKCLGFSHIYLYDHNSTEPLLNELKEHVASGFVVYSNYSAAHTKFKDGYTSDLDRFMSTVQGQAYKDCVDRFGGRHTFLGFIDIDEFLVIYDEKVRHVDELLRDYERHPGLSIYWVLLGSSGHKTQPEGLVVDQYKACTPHDHKFNTQFKTFVNTGSKPVMYSPHRAVFAAPPDPETGLEPYMVDENHNRVPRGRNKNSTHTRAAVYHYVTKSKKDFDDKMERGGGAGVTRPSYYYDLINKYSSQTCEGAVRTRQRFCGGKLPQVLSDIVTGSSTVAAAAASSGGPGSSSSAKQKVTAAKGAKDTDLA